MPNETKYCTNCGQQIDIKAEICPKCGVRQPGTANPGDRNRLVAAILAILLVGISIHKFHLGSIGWGIVYILFCWTLIPALVALIEGIIYLTMPDEAFQEKYGRK